MEYSELVFIKNVNSKIPIDQVLKHLRISKNNSGFINCPGHSDRKPSLKVYGKEGRKHEWVCFQCGRKGRSVDFFSFIKKVSLLDAANSLASIFAINPKGVNVPVITKRSFAPSVSHGWSRAFSRRMIELIFSENNLGLREHLYSGWFFFGQDLMDQAEENFNVTNNYSVLDETSKRVKSYISFIKEAYIEEYSA